VQANQLQRSCVSPQVTRFHTPRPWPAAATLGGVFAAGTIIVTERAVIVPCRSQLRGKVQLFEGGTMPVRRKVRRSPVISPIPNREIAGGDGSPVAALLASTRPSLVRSSIPKAPEPRAFAELRHRQRVYCDSLAGGCGFELLYG
jgi:hypothetical protein